MARALYTDLDDLTARPYFALDEDLRMAEVRDRLDSADPQVRTLWMARVMREARYRDVWKLLRLDDVVAHFDDIAPRLGRMRAFWQWLLDGWREDGFLPRT